MSAIVSTPTALTSRVAARGARATVSKAAVRGFSSASMRRSTVVVRASFDEAAPAPAEEVVEAPKPDKITAFKNTMAFGGWAPETINGRVAQIAFVAGLGAELSTGESFTAQFSEHVGAIVFASGLITLASFMPNMQNTDEYKANPETLKPSAPWTIDAERANGRGAMVGLVSMLILEKVIGGPITGVFSSAPSDELLSNRFYDDSFKNEVVAVAPAAVPAAGFVDFYAADAAAPAVDVKAAYEAAEAAEPLRVEGAVDLKVEAEAMELGRLVSAAEDAAADAAAM